MNTESTLYALRILLIIYILGFGIGFIKKDIFRKKSESKFTARIGSIALVGMLTGSVGYCAAMILLSLGQQTEADPLGQYMTISWSVMIINAVIWSAFLLLFIVWIVLDIREQRKREREQKIENHEDRIKKLEENTILCKVCMDRPIEEKEYKEETTK